MMALALLACLSKAITGFAAPSRGLPHLRSLIHTSAPAARAHNGFEMTRPVYLPEPSETDVNMVQKLLGRPPMGLWTVQSYCPSGHPKVLRVHPLMVRKKGEEVTPFPTLFWLTCAHYRSCISRLECEGYILTINKLLEEDKKMADQYLKDQESYRTMRLESLSEEERRLLNPSMMRRFTEGYIGGSANPRRIRCLHENFAHFLATGNNVVGEYIWNLGVIPPCPDCNCCDDNKMPTE
mmetsp:Transcript_932/g.1304  ORF Transcript_932/g.1304 Transcript_932/m.1304 type:complete len:238 (-) Transcript_932:121-834(-)